MPTTQPTISDSPHGLGGWLGGPGSDRQRQIRLDKPFDLHKPVLIQGVPPQQKRSQKRHLLYRTQPARVLVLFLAHASKGIGSAAGTQSVWRSKRASLHRQDMASSPPTPGCRAQAPRPGVTQAAPSSPASLVAWRGLASVPQPLPLLAWVPTRHSTRRQPLGPPRQCPHSMAQRPRLLRLRQCCHLSTAGTPCSPGRLRKQTQQRVASLRCCQHHLRASTLPASIHRPRS